MQNGSLIDGLVSKIETCKPFFEKMSNNPYLRAIRDGFISLIPVILFSSIFLLVAFVPNIFDVYLPDDIVAVLMKAYSYSMGILALLMSMTVSRSLADAFNAKITGVKKINTVSVMAASAIAFFLVSVDEIDGGVSLGFFGSKGLITSFLIAFVVANIYRFCVANNITIKMPKEVPPNIAQTFADLIPMASTVILVWLVDHFFRAAAGISLPSFVLEIFKPLFSAADGYIGLAIVYGAMAFFWFIGIHGPSIVEPAVSAVYIANVEANFMMFQAGEHATNILSQGSQYFVATLGGTGATLVTVFLCTLVAKSQQLKAIGKASFIPVCFGINEPVLFGIPLVLNPVFFIPFLCAPIMNIWLLRFFVQDLGMNGFIYNLPWTTPGPIGLILGTGFAGMSFVLAPLLIVLDFLLYLPFFKAYDKSLCEKEAAGEVEPEPAPAPAPAPKKAEAPAAAPKAAAKGGMHVLVLCANGATSSMLAKAIQTGAEEQGLDLKSTAMAYGQHKAVLDNFDLIVLAPQMGSMLGELQADVEGHKPKAASTDGRTYVTLCRTPKKALEYALAEINK